MGSGTWSSGFIAGDDVGAARSPFSPVSPDRGAGGALGREDGDAKVKFFKAFGDVAGGGGNADVGFGEGGGGEEFFKAAVGEGSKEARADFLARETFEDGEFGVAVDEVRDLGAVDAEEEGPRRGQLEGVWWGEGRRGAYLGYFEGLPTRFTEELEFPAEVWPEEGGTSFGGVTM